MYTLKGEIVIPCLLSVCFDDAMHWIYASYCVNTDLEDVSHREHKGKSTERQDRLYHLNH